MKGIVRREGQKYEKERKEVNEKKEISWTLTTVH